MATYPLQSIFDIAELMNAHGVDHAVLSPGSRCAPLMISFARHPGITCYSVSDERSASYIALGMSQALAKPVVLICTSGTAATNYASAVAEAYYLQVPLVVLTADRPPEWIDQQDGQAIRQNNLFSSFVKASFTLPATYEHVDEKWHINRMLNEAMRTSKASPQGPVHINVPLREPFYPNPDQQLAYSKDLRVVDEFFGQRDYTENEWDRILSEFSTFKKVLVVAGQGRIEKDFQSALSQCPFPIVADIMSNAQGISGATVHQDAFLMRQGHEAERLRPDLLITFGGSVISKNLKLFLRKYGPIAHWHIAEDGYTPDTFQTLTRILRVSPTRFFDKVGHHLPHIRANEFKDLWMKADASIANFQPAFFRGQAFGEFEAVYRVLQAIPDNTVLHLANSMSVRYANFVGVKGKKVEVYANRGTSGIDGCLSTAVGHAAVHPDRLHLLIIGDVSFMYDRNGLWNNLPKRNLRILLLNNAGGVIFRMIEGPARLPELPQFFQTSQPHDARLTAEEFGFSYAQASTREDFLSHLPSFLVEAEQPMIWEVKTAAELNQQIFGAFKEKIKAS